MSGIYTVQFNGVATIAGSPTVTQDLFQITAHASKQCVLLAWGVSQSSDVGDAAEEGLSILVKSGQTSTGSGGSAPTPASTDPVNAATVGFTAQANNTTIASGGTILTHYAYNWNIRIPMDQVYTDQQQIIFGAGRRLTIELATAPADSVTLSGYAVIQEIG